LDGNTRCEKFYNGISAVVGKGLGCLCWIVDTNENGTFHAEDDETNVDTSA
jgi:hypothetical protein